MNTEKLITALLSHCFVIVLVCATYISIGQTDWQKLQKVERYQLFELVVPTTRQYDDPFRDVELVINLTDPFGRELRHYGFWDGEGTWRIRFSPDITGMWSYSAFFSDDTLKISGAFGCISNTQPGRIGINAFNPFWLGKGVNTKDLYRSFHVGDRFFATNWDDPFDGEDGNLRIKFLDWFQEMGYNMISVASFFTNRNVPGRGQGWDTPRPWPLNPEEYRKIEAILDELKSRDIVVFPFAGIFGLGGDWPIQNEEQELYIKYLLVRLGHYPNLILNIAGPEPTWRKEPEAYKGAMRLVDIKRIGAYIDSIDVHNLILTVHNEKRATQYGDPFIDEPWYCMSTLQGPTTGNRDVLFSGLTKNHHRYKPAFAQETLWIGNLYHPAYSSDQLRKNALTILFAGSTLNFADNNGLSSTGFSGSCDINDANTDKHLIIKKVWDWFETIPFHTMVVRQDLVKQGFCLANEGQEYYVYRDTIGEIELFLNFGYDFNSRWINAENPLDIRTGPIVQKNTVFHTPEDGNDWILHVFANKPALVAYGNFPDIATDQFGNIHIVYNRNGLKYKLFNKKSGTWSDEQDTGCKCEHIERSDPDIVVDSKGLPHVFCGNDYAWFDGSKWHVSKPGGTRDTELAIDSHDNVYLTHRGGNNGGYIGLRKKDPGAPWVSLTDPDQQNKGTNDHHYADICIDKNNHIHIIHRNGPVVRNVYRKSTDGGISWPIEEPVSDRWDEAPHIVVDQKGMVYITTGMGELFKRNLEGIWKELGRKVHVSSRMQPELGIDNQDNLYITAFGGRHNSRYNNVWMGEKLLEQITTRDRIGFVETAGSEKYVYIIWEEGEGDAHDGLKDDAAIIVGRLYPDGRIVGL